MHVALSYVLRLMSYVFVLRRVSCLTFISMSCVSSLLYRNISIPVLLYFTETEKTRVPAYITLPTGQRYNTIVRTILR